MLVIIVQVFCFLEKKTKRKNTPKYYTIFFFLEQMAVWRVCCVYSLQTLFLCFYQTAPMLFCNHSLTFVVLSLDMKKCNIKSRKGFLISHLIQMSWNKMERIGNWMIWNVFVFKVPPQYRRIWIDTIYLLPGVYTLYLLPVAAFRLRKMLYVKVFFYLSLASFQNRGNFLYL